VLLLLLPLPVLLCLGKQLLTEVLLLLLLTKELREAHSHKARYIVAVQVIVSNCLNLQAPAAGKQHTAPRVQTVAHAAVSHAHTLMLCQCVQA
jgi:hypothetical protein